MKPLRQLLCSFSSCSDLGTYIIYNIYLRQVEIIDLKMLFQGEKNIGVKTAEEAKAENARE